MSDVLNPNDVNVIENPAPVAQDTIPAAPAQNVEQTEVQVDPAFANYFDNIYQPPQPQYAPPQYQYQNQANYPAAPVQYQTAPQAPQNTVPAFDFQKMDTQELLQKFDENPQGVLRAVAEQAAQSARDEILKQLPNVLNPHLKSVEQNIVMKQTQSEIANAVKSNLTKNGVALSPHLESITYHEVANTVDAAWSKYNQDLDMAVLTGQKVVPSLLNNGRRFTDKEFAVKYATEYATHKFKIDQQGRLQHNPQFVTPTANPVHNNTFPAVQGGTPTKDLRSMTAEELDNWGRSQGLKG